MKMTAAHLIDAIMLALIVLSISMTILTFLAARGPIADMQSFTANEIAPRGAGGNL